MYLKIFSTLFFVFSILTFNISAENKIIHTKFSNLEIGSSLVLGLNADNKEEMILFGTDLQYKHKRLLNNGEKHV